MLTEIEEVDGRFRAIVPNEDGTYTLACEWSDTRVEAENDADTIELLVKCGAVRGAEDMRERAATIAADNFICTGDEIAALVRAIQIEKPKSTHRGADVMTQRERLIQALKSIAQCEEARKVLDNVLGEAQNQPPEGQSDGSIREPEYTAARAVERAAFALDVALAAARVAFRR